jgi:hypothetical protein
MLCHLLLLARILICNDDYLKYKKSLSRSNMQRVFIRLNVLENKINNILFNCGITTNYDFIRGNVIINGVNTLTSI